MTETLQERLRAACVGKYVDFKLAVQMPIPANVTDERLYNGVLFLERRHITYALVRYLRRWRAVRGMP